MISVDAALQNLFDLAPDLGVEQVPLAQAGGRILAQPCHARRNQPPFAASAMDGYALDASAVRPNARFEVIGEAAAGHAFGGTVGPGQAVRIFTGAPVPEGATMVVLQEDCQRDGAQMTITGTPDGATNIRPAGCDFQLGDSLPAPRRLSPMDVALMAAMNIAQVPVARRPVVALISTGDELVVPGETPGPDQIIASNTFGLAAMLQSYGAQTRILPIARDNMEALHLAFSLAEGADVIVTIGGASVGDHDLVAKAGASLGVQQSFYKVAMRPGKPLMAGRLGHSVVLGLPGNPVSAMVCGYVFLLPMLRKMAGLPAAHSPMRRAALLAPLGANGARTHYMRARLTPEGITAFPRQDSALLRVLSDANALVIRPVGDPARAVGEMVDYMPLESE